MLDRYGATPDDWAHFKRLAKVDLLPVVSNPHREKSPASKMQEIGKTPSLFNHRDQVIGFTNWTEHETGVHNIEAWAKNPDLGICVQTRRTRALDIDVPDKKLAARIRKRFLELLGFDELPRRWRANSGKELLAFVIEGELSKRSFVVNEIVDPQTGKVSRWLVEFLATGQQFIACGTHPSGERYQWDNGRPPAWTTIALEDFDEAWDTLVAEFMMEGAAERRANRRDPTMADDLDVDDPVAEFLINSEWPTYGVERGKLYLDCPGKHLHGSDNGVTETSWLLAGTGGYRKGHFSCRHESCKEEFGTDAAFLKEVGYRPVDPAEFDDLSDLDAAVDAYLTEAPGSSAKSKELQAERSALAKSNMPLPGFIRDDGNRIETSLENVCRALRAPQACGLEIAFDTFRGELMLARTSGAWENFEDADAVQLRMDLEALGFRHKIGKEMMRDALDLVGRDRQFDSAIEWLMNVVPKWDGVARIHRFWPDYMKAKDTPYTRALGDYTWTAQAGRILVPGLKVDMVPVLVGEEGVRKSTAISLIAPDEDFFAEFNLGLEDEKLSRLMRGCLVGELAELRGISARDAESILAWITRRFEKWTPKFKEYAISLARRLVFYGTTNDPEFLQAHMGSRRWLPVVITTTIDTDRIVADRHQFWAEARDVFLYDGGVQWREVEELAKAEREAFQYRDPWHDEVAKFLDDGLDANGRETPRNCGKLTAEQVLVECCGLDPIRIKKPDQQRVAAILKSLRMRKKQGWVGSRNIKVWVDASSDDHA